MNFLSFTLRREKTDCTPWYIPCICPPDQPCFLSIKGSCLKWRWGGQRPRRKPHCQSLWQGRHIGPREVIEFTNLLHLFCTLPTLWERRKCHFRLHGRRCKSWEVCWATSLRQLGNEAIYQTRRPGCLALTPLGFALVKRGDATEVMVGVEFGNSFEHP